MDNLIIERWPDVMGLIDAHRGTQGRIEEMIEVVGERLTRWAQPLGFELETFARDCEFQASRPAWADRRKGSKVQLALGGFCPFGYRKNDSKHPYLWVYIDDLANFKVKEPERAAFARNLRAALGEDARSWEAEGVDDADEPLGRYLTDVSDADRAKVIASPDALFEFATSRYPVVFKLADTIEAELLKLTK